MSIWGKAPRDPTYTRAYTDQDINTSIIILLFTLPFFLILLVAYRDKCGNLDTRDEDIDTSSVRRIPFLKANCRSSGEKLTSISRSSDDPSFRECFVPSLGRLGFPPTPMFTLYASSAAARVPRLLSFTPVSQLRPYARCPPLGLPLVPPARDEYAFRCENHDPNKDFMAGMERAIRVPPTSEVSMASMGS